MSALVNVREITLALFANKLRISLSNKLKECRLNSHQLRSLIFSNLQDLETKLVGLARGNLLTSLSNIREGLRLLDALVLKKKRSRKKIYCSHKSSVSLIKRQRLVARRVCGSQSCGRNQ